MKRIIPALIAAAVFFFALVLMRPESTVPLLAAAVNMEAGHAILETDLVVRQVPASSVPAGAFTDPAQVVGQTLRQPRTAGDLLFPANLGGENLELAPNERAIALRVSDSGGLSGLVKPGDTVGLTAILPGSRSEKSDDDSEKTTSGPFSKYLAGNLRVLYISPEFTALDPAQVNPQAAADSSGFSAANTTRQRSSEGVVVLAVPVDARIILYDFLLHNQESEARWVYLVDLLPALDSSGEVSLSLVLEPEDPADFTTSGVFLPDLMVLDGGAIPTATPGPQSPNLP